MKAERRVSLRNADAFLMLKMPLERQFDEGESMRRPFFLEQSTDDPLDVLVSRFVFRLSTLEENFQWIHPTDDLGSCWPCIDQHVNEYPDLFPGSCEYDAEGIEVRRDAEGEFIIPDCSGEALPKIRQVLEYLISRMAVDGHADVFPIPTDAMLVTRSPLGAGEV